MRILVVEDEPRLLRNLAKALREEGYAVDTAETGDEGLYKAESYGYDAVVLGVMLPGLDGCWSVSARKNKLPCSCSLRAMLRGTACVVSTRARMTTW
jgi:DNA-binding response OmpR family regulator